MIKASDLRLHKLGSPKYADVRFHLHWIGGVSTAPGKNFYYARFRSIKSKNNFTITEEIPPELLRHYVIGNIYRQGGLIGKINSRSRFSITLPEGKSRIVKIKDIPPPEPDGGGSPALLRPSWIENQYALLSEDGGYSIVIPCHVIGAAFYFTCTVMRKRVFDARIEELYSETGFDEEKGLPYIMPKSEVSDRYAAYVYFYASDEYANRAWHSVRNGMYAEYAARGSGANLTEGIPLKVEPPFRSSVRMFVDGIVVEQRKMFVVYDILKLETPIFDYDSLIVRRYRGGSVRESEVGLREAVFRIRARTGRTVSGDRPSWKNPKKGVANDAKDGDVFSSVELVRETITGSGQGTGKASGGIAIKNAVQLKDGGTKSLSFNSSTDARNRDARQAHASLKGKDPFTFEDFKELIGMFIDKYSEGIKGGNAVFSGPFKMPVDRERSYLREKEGYDRKDSIREYMTARFVFQRETEEKHILLVELSRKSSLKGFSTFIFAGKTVISEATVRDFLKEYVSNETLDRITGIFRRLAVKFFRKKHPDKGDKDKSFKARGKDLYNKIKVALK